MDWLYDSVEHRLLRVVRDGHQEVPLSPQQHRLVGHMAERNRVEDGRPVLCTREELIAAVWGDEPGHGPQDLAYLVHQVRARLDEVASAPLIVNERGRGYRLLAGGLMPDPPADVSRARRVRRRRLLLAGAAALAVTALIATGVAINAARAPEPVLREGSRGEDVLALQRDLSAAGYDPVYLDGQFGPLTGHAVRAFQQDNGLVVDGEVGPETRAALRRAVEARGG